MPNNLLAGRDKRADVVRRIVEDGDWSNPLNRQQSRIARSLYCAGVDTDVIYAALLAGAEDQ